MANHSNNYCAEHDQYFGHRGCTYCADAASNVIIEEEEQIVVRDPKPDEETMSVDEFIRTSEATIAELRAQLRMIEDGEAVVLPCSAPHARTMIAVAQSYLKGASDG